MTRRAAPSPQYVQSVADRISCARLDEAVRALEQVLRDIDAQLSAPLSWHRPRYENDTALPAPCESSH